MELPDWDFAEETDAGPSENNTEQEENGQYRCFLIESKERSRFVNSFGAPIPAKRLREDRSDYDERLALANSKVSSTDSRRSYFTKLTVYESKPGELDLGLGALESIKEKANRERNRPLYWQEIPEKHCTICYHSDHFREDCNRCGWCRQEGHFKHQCPQNAQTRERVAINLVKHESLKNKPWKREFLKDNGVSAWWKQPGKIHSFWLKMMKPIGPQGKEKPTFALDTE